MRCLGVEKRLFDAVAKGYLVRKMKSRELVAEQQEVRRWQAPYAG
jgi:hypothetical protein